MTRLVLLTCAAALPLVALAPPGLALGVRIVVGVLTTAVAGLAVRRIADPTVWLFGLSFPCFLLFDVLEGPAPTIAMLPLVVGYLAVCGGAVRLLRAAGRPNLRRMLGEATLATSAVAATLLGPTDLGGGADAVVIFTASVFLTAIWSQVLTLGWGNARVVTTLSLSLALQVVSATLLLAVPELLRDVALAVEIGSRILFAAALVQPTLENLLAERVESEQRVLLARGATALGAMLACVLLLRLRTVVGDDVPLLVGFVRGLLLVRVVVTFRALLVRARRDNDALLHIAFRDAVTDLPNERGLLRRMADADGTSTALVLVHLRGFRALLHRLDADAAEALVRSLAQRLEHVRPDGAVLARPDRDEFALLTDRDVHRLATAIEDVLEDALRTSASAASVQVRVRIGWVTLDDDVDELLAGARHASLAAAPGRPVELDVAMRAGLDRERLVLDAFPAALRDGDVVPCFQPIVATATGCITGFEVLARWTHPTLGAVSPGQFIPLAESSGAIHELGARLLRQACLELAGWRRRTGDRSLTIAVNVSPLQLADDTLVPTVLSALSNAGLPADALVLELTEGLLVDLDHGIGALTLLQSHGVALAVDDFGTGYSSLAYLHQLRPDVVKVDRRFTAALTSDGDDVARGIFTLMDQLGLPTVAEGVEDAATLAALRTLGCGRWQGYLRSPAVPAGEALALLLADADTATRSTAAAAALRPV